MTNWKKVKVRKVTTEVNSAACFMGWCLILLGILVGFELHDITAIIKDNGTMTMGIYFSMVINFILGAACVMYGLIGGKQIEGYNIKEVEVIK